MGLTVTTIAPTVLLSTLEQLKLALQLTTGTEDEFLEAKLVAASAAVNAYCGRIFARQAYQELAPARGGIEFLTAQAPVVALGAVTFRGAVLTDVTIDDADAGILYRQLGFDWTAQRFGGLGASGRGLDFGTPLPTQDEPLWLVDYTAGFVLPDENLLGVSTVSVVGADQSFNDSAGRFPRLLKAGDVLEASGFTAAGNNGRFLVAGVPTTTKVIVSGAALVNEAEAAARNLKFQTLPADVEQATIETAVSMYANRATDGNIVEKQAGLMRLRYSEQGADVSQIGLPGVAAARLRKWTR